MANLTFEQAVEVLQDIAQQLKEMKEKYPEAKREWVKLSLNWWKFEKAKRDWSWVYYSSLNWKNIWIELNFSSEDEYF